MRKVRFTEEQMVAIMRARHDAPLLSTMARYPNS